MEVETSIIIRALNEEVHIERLLRGIQQQTCQNWEIILVDSGSTDSTVEIAKRYTSNIYHISSEDFTFGRSLNLGCRHANGNYLVFCSAHAYPVNDNWLGNLVRPFQDPSVGMVYGRQRGVETTRLTEERDLRRLFDLSSMILIDRPFGNNANSAIRRGLWSNQPFDETLTGLEDIDWARKIQRDGCRVYYAADAAIYHVHDESLRQIYRRFFREGVAFRRIFPGYRFGRLDLFKSLLFNLGADLLYGLRGRKSMKKILQAFSARPVELYAQYRGVNNHRELSKEMLIGLYYPKLAESVVIDKPGQWKILETQVPALEEDEVLIQVAYVGVCATDLEVAKGHLEYYLRGYARYPIVPGHEYSGVVVDVGSKVQNLRKGYKVVGECALGCGHCEACRRAEFYRCGRRREVGVINHNGAYSQYLKLPAIYVHRIPRSVTLKEAALIEPLAVSVKGLRKLNISKGLSACIVGAGPLGNFCAQLLRKKGVRVTVVDRDERRLKLLYKYDINTRTEIKALDEFDYLLELTGDEEVIPRLIEHSKSSAKILLLGLPYQNQVPVSFGTVPCYDKEIYGSIASQPSDWDEAIHLLANRSVNTDDHLANILPLAEYERAWKYVQDRERFKVLLLCNPALEGA